MRKCPHNIDVLPRLHSTYASRQGNNTFSSVNHLALRTYPTVKACGVSRAGHLKEQCDIFFIVTGLPGALREPQPKKDITFFNKPDKTTPRKHRSINKHEEDRGYRLAFLA